MITPTTKPNGKMMICHRTGIAFASRTKAHMQAQRANMTARVMKSMCRKINIDPFFGRREY